MKTIILYAIIASLIAICAGSTIGALKAMIAQHHEQIASVERGMNY